VYDVQLVVAREDLLADWMSGDVWFLDDLCVVLDDVGETLAREYVMPQVPRLDAAGVGWVARTVVGAFIERQEQGVLAGQLRAELDLLIIDSEVRQAPPKLEQQLPRVAVTLVLLDRIVHRLVSQLILELKRCHRQAIDEQAQVQGQLCLVQAVPQLARDTEDVGVI